MIAVENTVMRSERLLVRAHIFNGGRRVLSLQVDMVVG